MNQFEYNAPQFRDFKEDFDDSDGADTFFDVESDEPTEKTVVDENKENSQPMKGLSPMKTIKEETRETSLELSAPLSKNQEKPISNTKKRDKVKAVRRLSGVDPEKLSNDLNKLSMKNKRRTCFDGIALCVKEDKHHTMTTRSDQVSNTPTIELRTRLVLKEPMEGSRKRKSDFGDKRLSTKYMAMAERILHFQKDTPPRFHSNRRLSAGRSNMLKARKSYNPRRTIALTPKLMTAMRARQHSDVLTTEQKEEMELEEMRKHQVKPIPLNEKIFQPPKPPRRSVRPPLVAEPFNLTEVFKKPAIPEGEPYKFTANPVPKAILQKPTGIGKKPEISVTVPQSPAITKPTRQMKPVRLALITNDNKQSMEDLHSHGVHFTKFDRKTEVKPFSFEIRDKQMIEKREKRLQEILQAEKKAREFKANPAPAFSVPKETNRSSKLNHLDCSKSSSMMSLTDEGPQPFKARSPRVLRKQPFEPKLEHSHSQPLDVQLWTQRRVLDRQAYEIKQMEKQERLACLREEYEMEKKRKEEEEIMKMRKEAVHKAQPVPKFIKERVLLPKIPDMPITNPMSPRFSKRTRISVACTKSQPK